MPRKHDVICCRACGLVLAQFMDNVRSGERGWYKKLRAVEIDILPPLDVKGDDRVRCPDCDTPWFPNPTHGAYPAHRGA
jgi:hypothetical protein